MRGAGEEKRKKKRRNFGGREEGGKENCIYAAFIQSFVHSWSLCSRRQEGIHTHIHTALYCIALYCGAGRDERWRERKEGRKIPYCCCSFFRLDSNEMSTGWKHGWMDGWA